MTKSKKAELAFKKLVDILMLENMTKLVPNAQKAAECAIEDWSITKIYEELNKRNYCWQYRYDRWHKKWSKS